MADTEKGQLPLARLSNDEQEDRSNNTNEQINQVQIDRNSRPWLSKALGDVYAQDNPMDLSKSKKNTIILVVALGGIFGPLASMIYMPSLVDIANSLNTTTASVNATVSTYVVFLGIAVSGTCDYGSSLSSTILTLGGTVILSL